MRRHGCTSAVDKIVVQNACIIDYLPAGPDATDAAVGERIVSRAQRNLDITVRIGTSSKAAISA